MENARRETVSGDQIDYHGTVTKADIGFGTDGEFTSRIYAVPAGLLPDADGKTGP
jgi:hypothetical protein